MVEIKFTYDYDKQYLPIYHELFESEFTGRNWAKNILCLSCESICDNMKEGFKELLLNRQKNPDALPMMVILENDIPVGLSFPKNLFTANESEAFRIPNDKSYYKIGSIIIKQSYRNKGIAVAACQEFLKLYPKIVYQVDERNIASIRVAEKLGLTYSHNTTLNGINYEIYKS